MYHVFGHRCGDQQYPFINQTNFGQRELRTATDLFLIKRSRQVQIKIVRLQPVALKVFVHFRPPRFHIRFAGARLQAAAAFLVVRFRGRMLCEQLLFFEIEQHMMRIVQPEEYGKDERNAQKDFN